MQAMEPQDTNTDSKLDFNSLARAWALVKCFNPDQLELSTREMIRKVGQPKSSVYRTLATLTKLGLLDRDIKTGKYSIGPELFAQGSLYLETSDIHKAAEPVIKTLNELTNEALSISILENGNVIFIMREEPKYDFKFIVHIGKTYPAYSSAMGKAFLSEFSEAEIDNLYPEERLRPVTKKTISTKSELRLELQQIRRDGISIDREGSTEGIIGIGSIIRNASGKTVAGMSIAVPVFRIDESKLQRIIILVKLGCSLVSYRLGYKDMVNPVRDVGELVNWWKQN